MTDHKVYTLTLTEKQLKYIADACESCGRVAIGQFDKMLDYCRNNEGNFINNYNLTKAVESIIKPAMGLSMNSSYGVGKFDHADILLDMYQTIRHRLAWDNAYATGILKPGERRKYEHMMTVDYDPPSKWGSEPIPIINGKSPPENELR